MLLRQYAEAHPDEKELVDGMLAKSEDQMIRDFEKKVKMPTVIENLKKIYERDKIFAQPLADDTFSIAGADLIRFNMSKPMTKEQFESQYLFHGNNGSRAATQGVYFVESDAVYLAHSFVAPQRPGTLPISLTGAEVNRINQTPTGAGELPSVGYDQMLYGQKWKVKYNALMNQYGAYMKSGLAYSNHVRRTLRVTWDAPEGKDGVAVLVATTENVYDKGPGPSEKKTTIISFPFAFLPWGESWSPQQKKR
jgi:hypothetical protein